MSSTAKIITMYWFYQNILKFLLAMLNVGGGKVNKMRTISCKMSQSSGFWPSKYKCFISEKSYHRCMNKMLVYRGQGDLVGQGELGDFPRGGNLL